MFKFALPALPLAIALAGCAATPAQIAQEERETAQTQARLDKRLAGYEPGKPMDCIRPYNANIDIYGDTIVYRDSGRRLYKTVTSGGCFGLKRDDIVVTKSWNGQLCRGDLVRTVDRTNGFPSGACSFGEFVPYTKAPRG